jgi:hypothetical protein
MLASLPQSIDSFRARRYADSSRHSPAMADLPPTLYSHWKRSAHLEFRGIPQDAFFFARAAEGLLMFFDCVARSGKPCALPSHAADSVWLAWMQLAPLGLTGFCLKHFGRTIPHPNAERVQADLDLGLRNSLIQSRRREGIDSMGADLPRLFTLDSVLHMPKGFHFSIVEGDLMMERLDAAGRQQDRLQHPYALSAVARRFHTDRVTRPS